MTHPPYPVYSGGWFDYCFEPVEVPADIRAASEAMCKRFAIRGICDPMYVANCIGMLLGRGDGCGKFHAADSQAANEFDTRLAQLEKKLCHAYSTCIGSDSADVRPLLIEHLRPGSPRLPA